MLSSMSRPRAPVMLVFFSVELSPVWDVAHWGSELYFILEGMALCAKLLLLLYARVIHESCYNA